MDGPLLAENMPQDPRCASKLEEFARNKIAAYLGTLNPDGTYKDRIYRSARSAALQIARDYGRRFLLELVQNAHDAHPPADADGEIRIVFDPAEGQAGVLYLANRGQGFSWENVDALCSIGLSDKPIGESIGNKGLGFRSIVHVSDNPEIYSRLGCGGIGGTFDGYCFRFAGDSDLDSWISDPVLSGRAKQDLPPFHIPIPIADVPEHAQRLAREGCCTVIRLPIRDDVARRIVFDEVAAIRDQGVPLLLFLRRVNSLNVVVEGDPRLGFRLAQEFTPLTLAIGNELQSENDRITLVQVGEDAQYLIATTLVPEEMVRAEIQASIRENRLSGSWADWRGDGELAVAVRLDGPVSPRIYTYLPLGKDAHPPFHGFLHASFFPKLDRTSLETDVPLNSLYVREAGALCVRAAIALRRGAEAGAITTEYAGSAILDLLCWQGYLGLIGDGRRRAASLIGDAFAALGMSIQAMEGVLVQRLPSGARWATFGNARKWDRPELTALSKDSMVTLAAVPVLADELGSERVNRLDTFLKELNRGLHLELSGQELATAIEQVAIGFWQRQVEITTWKKFYRELRDVVVSHTLDVRGRRLLLCGDGTLKQTLVDASDVDFSLDSSTSEQAPPSAANKKRRRRRTVDTAIFMPSERATGEAARTHASVAIPPELQSAFLFLSEELDWYGELNQVRDFLERRKLVRPYNAEELLVQVSHLVRGDDRVSVRRAALVWAFQLFQQSQASRAVSLRRARLYVPTAANEWIDARSAHFGAGWPAETQGDTLDRFLASASAHSEELQALRTQLVARPVAKPFSMRQIHDWTGFLTALGVQRGLQPKRREPRGFRVWGWEFSSAKLTPRLGLGEETARVWAVAIAESGVQPSYASSDHNQEGGLWAFPGQDEHVKLSAEARMLYASLVLAWLETGEQNELEVQFYNPTFHRASRFSWPTPLAAFLRHGEWLPAEWSDGVQTEVRFQRPRDVWLGDDGPHSLPPYMPGFPRGLRTFLARHGVIERLVSWAGANVFNAAHSLRLQVGFLAEIYADNRISPYHLKAFLNTYYESWRYLAGNQPANRWSAADRPEYLIVRRSGVYELVKTGQPEATTAARRTTLPPLYIRDVESSLSVSLVEAMGARVFDTGAPIPVGLRPLVQGLLGTRARTISAIEVALMLDGVDFDPDRMAGDFAVTLCPWMPVLVTLAMESLAGLAVQRLPADRRVIVDRLQRIHLRPTRAVMFRAEGAVLPAPDDLQGAIAFAHETKPTVILQSATGELDWRLLARGLRAFSELLGITDLAPHLQIGMAKLEQLGELVAGPIPADQRLDELCEALHVRRTEAEVALAALDTDTYRLVRFLTPVVHYFGGPTAANRLQASAGEARSTADVSNVLRMALMNLDSAPEVIVGLCRRARSFAEVRQELGLDFGRFNRSLMAVGEQPDLYPDLHSEALRIFMADHRDQIMDSLRAPYIAAFQRCENLAAYVQARGDLDTVRPDQDWLLDYYEPDEKLLRSRVNNWLSTLGAAEVGSATTGLPAWSVARRENSLLVRKLVSSFAPSIHAWCRKQGSEVPGVWRLPSSAADVIGLALDQVGALDFEIVDEAMLLRWIATAAMWPSGMPQSRSLGALGLTEADLNEERERERTARLERAKVARSIEFNGRNVDPHEADYAALSSEIATKLSRAVSSQSLGGLATVQRPPEPGQRAGTGHGGLGSGGARRLPPEKTDLIGVLGECAVYHWLKGQLPKQDVDAAWVSRNRSRLLLGEGRDDLGYDFEIRFRRQSLLLEVKAHLDDPQNFELGETELREAHACAQRRNKEYRIVYVSNLRDTSAMQIEVLPNPLGPDGQVRFAKGEQGVRYAFRRA